MVFVDMAAAWRSDRLRLVGAAGVMPIAGAASVGAAATGCSSCHLTARRLSVGAFGGDVTPAVAVLAFLVLLPAAGSWPVGGAAGELAMMRLSSAMPTR